MLELVEKTLLAGIGALALTQKKAEELLDELKDKLNLSEDEGKKLLDKFQDAAKEGRQRVEELAQEEVKKACGRIGVVTAEEFGKLQKKVEHLEKQFKAQAK